MKEMLHFTHPPNSPSSLSNKHLRRGYKNKENLSIRVLPFLASDKGTSVLEAAKRWSFGLVGLFW